MKVCIACNAASVTCVCLVCHNGLCNECIPGWIDSAMPRVTMKGLPCFVCAQPVPFDRAATKTRSGAALRALAEENETKASIRNARDYFPCPSMGCRGGGFTRIPCADAACPHCGRRIVVKMLSEMGEDEEHDHAWRQFQDHFVVRCPECHAPSTKTGGCRNVVCAKCHHAYVWGKADVIETPRIVPAVSVRTERRLAVLGLFLIIAFFAVEGYRFHNDQSSIMMSLVRLVYSFSKALIAEIQSHLVALTAAASKLIAALARAGLHAARLVFKSLTSDGFAIAVVQLSLWFFSKFCARKVQPQKTRSKVALTLFGCFSMVALAVYTAAQRPSVVLRHL